MSLLLKVIPRTIPVIFREKILTDLFAVTAKAFECPPPSDGGLVYHERLQAYALFTRHQAEKALRSGKNITTIKTRLYQSAYPLGEKLRIWFAVSNMEEIMRLGQILYQAIGVEAQGDSQGKLVVKSCYFCQFYTGAVCDLISALDDGIFSGLSGGGRLVFSERLTEGRKCCIAKLEVGKK